MPTTEHAPLHAYLWQFTAWACILLYGKHVSTYGPKRCATTVNVFIVVRVRRQHNSSGRGANMRVLRQWGVNVPLQFPPLWNTNTMMHVALHREGTRRVLGTGTRESAYMIRYFYLYCLENKNLSCFMPSQNRIFCAATLSLGFLYGIVMTEISHTKNHNITFNMD